MQNFRNISVTGDTFTTQSIHQEFCVDEAPIAGSNPVVNITEVDWRRVTNLIQLQIEIRLSRTS